MMSTKVDIVFKMVGPDIGNQARCSPFLQKPLTREKEAVLAFAGCGITGAEFEVM